MAAVETRNEKQAAGATELAANINGKIVEFLWHLTKQGLTEITVKGYRERLQQLVRKGVDLLNPETVKEFLAKQSSWSNRTKTIDIIIYDRFLKFLKIPWEPPIYRPEGKIPFIPTEQEIDQLIAATGKTISTFLQMLKETGMRRGEGLKVKWTDIDFERKTIRVTPEKGSNPRLLPISQRLSDMLKNRPKKSDRVFSMTTSALTSNFYLQRKTIARKLGNPRLLEIGFHTFRHWKGTMEYHKTKDPEHVKRLLGHKRMDSTMLYINIEQATFENAPPDQFHVKVAQTTQEITSLLETGFEYVLQKDGIVYFKKRK